MASPLLEKELREYLITQITDLTQSNITIGIMPGAAKHKGVPMTFATIYANGGETERRIRVRIMTRSDDMETAMLLANDIYDSLQRLHECDLTTYRLYMVTGERPQQSGREEEGGGFLTSADYLIEFTVL